MSKNHTFAIIPNTKHILSSLIENINNHELFQKHVQKMENSAKPADVKKAMLINNTMHNINVYNTKQSPLFLAKDIGILLGISHIKLLTKKFEVDEKVIGHMQIKNKNKEVIFLTKLGVYRCFYASRSPLARLFRKFIGNLLDHMMTHETELLQKISRRFQIDNPELIEKGIDDLHKKAIKYEQKYIEEKKRAAALAIECEDERKKREESEKEKIKMDISNSYNLMHIEQLKQEKESFIERIKNTSDDDEPIDLKEMRLLKERFMKPLYVYILHPTYFGKLIRNPSAKITSVAEIGNNNVKSKQLNQEQLDLVIQDLPTYTKNFNDVFSSKSGIHIDYDEILYYYVGISRNVAKANKIIHVNTQRVVNKIHYGQIINELTKTCSTLTLGKYTLYKTTLEEIGEITRETFCQEDS